MDEHLGVLTRFPLYLLFRCATKKDAAAIVNAVGRKASPGKRDNVTKGPLPFIYKPDCNEADFSSAK
jgi:hypothetical protein